MMENNKEYTNTILDGFGDRLAEVMGDHDITAYQVAKQLEVRPNTIYNAVNKRQYASLKLIVDLLLLFPKVNANWFILGKGPKYLEGLDDLLEYRTNYKQHQKNQIAFIQSLRTLVDDYEKSIATALGDTEK